MIMMMIIIVIMVNYLLKMNNCDRLLYGVSVSVKQSVVPSFSRKWATPIE